MLNIDYNEEKWEKKAFFPKMRFFCFSRYRISSYSKTQERTVRWKKQWIYFNAFIHISFPWRTQGKGTVYALIFTPSVTWIPSRDQFLVEQITVIPTNSKPKTYIDLCQTLRFKFKKNNIFWLRHSRANGEKKYKCQNWYKIIKPKWIRRFCTQFYKLTLS